MPNGEKTENKPKAPPCTCYCLLNWIPGTARDLPISNVITPSFLGMTETETGDVIQDTNVRTKNYVCNTTTEIPPPSDQVENPPKNPYSQTRTRSASITYTWVTVWCQYFPYLQVQPLRGVHGVCGHVPMEQHILHKNHYHLLDLPLIAQIWDCLVLND